MDKIQQDGGYDWKLLIFSLEKFSGGGGWVGGGGGHLIIVSLQVPIFDSETSILSLF